MRDPNRIDKFCDELNRLWHQIPDWRFGQLMINAIEAHKEKYSYDSFYMEDDEFIKYLYDYIRSVTNG